MRVHAHHGISECAHVCRIDRITCTHLALEGSMVQKGKFSAGTALPVSRLNRVDLPVHTHTTNTQIHMYMN